MNTLLMYQPIGIVGLIITNTMILVLLREIISAMGIHLHIIRAVLLGVQLVVEVQQQPQPQPLPLQPILVVALAAGIA